MEITDASFIPPQWKTQPWKNGVRELLVWILSGSVFTSSLGCETVWGSPCGGLTWEKEQLLGGL